MQRKINEGLAYAFGSEDVTDGQPTSPAEDVGADDENDPVLFLLTQEEQRRLDRLPAAERRRVIAAMKASARSTADALLGTEDDD